MNESKSYSCLLYKMKKINSQPQFFTVLSHSLATTFWVGNFGSIFEGRRTVYWNQFLFSITRVQRLCFYIYKWHSYFHGPPVTGNENCFFIIITYTIIIIITILSIFIGVEYQWYIVLFSAPVADAMFLSFRLFSFLSLYMQQIQ